MATKTPSARKGAANRSGTIDASDAIPLRYGDDPYVWACWLYYEDGMTQGEIAEAMGVSRATVNSYLADAREKGIVNISIEPARLASLTIAQELKRHFGLTDCLVVPSDDNAGSLIDRLGAAAAQALPKLLKSGDTLAVAWGRTVLSVGEHAGIASLQDMTVVQATGGTTASFAYTRSFVPRRSRVQFRPAASTSPRRPWSNRPSSCICFWMNLWFRSSSRTGEGKPGAFRHLLASAEFHHSYQRFLRIGLAAGLSGAGAVGVVAGRFIDERGRPVAGPLDDRTVGISLDLLRKIGTRIAVAGGFDKVPALLAALRGGYVNVLITDAATGHGILRADGVTALDAKLSHRPKLVQTPSSYRTHVKKFLNNPNEVVEEMLDGVVRAHEKYLQPINGSHRALVARNGPRPGKVGLVIGGGTGHEPCFLGYVGKGLADAVAVGNIFSSPPPDPIVQCAEAASGGEGVLFVYGNYAGDVMNFEMAAEIAEEKGIKVKTVLTTDDVASSPVEDREGRRGVAGISSSSRSRARPAIAACRWKRAKPSRARRTCAPIRWASRSNPARCRNAPAQFRDRPGRHGGRHGHPRRTGRDARAHPIGGRDTDSIMDRIFKEMRTAPGERVAVLVNSFGATPLMELYILFRRVQQRLAAKDILIEANWIGHYCTSLDMAGASITILHLDQELSDLLHHPCETAFLKVN